MRPKKLDSNKSQTLIIRINDEQFNYINNLSSKFCCNRSKVLRMIIDSYIFKNGEVINEDFKNN